MCAIKIGWARREISIDEPVNINGQMYLRISEGIHDPLYATALCVDGGEGQDAVIFCSCDMVGLLGGVNELLREAVAKKRPEIKPECIILNATHTHAAPALTNTAAKSPDGVDIYPGAKYREFFIEQCAQAVCEAWDTRARGGMAYGYGYAVVGHSRRVIYFEDMSQVIPNQVAPNGHGIMYGRTNRPEFSHYEAGADHFLNLMFTFDAKQKLTGIVVNVPCPSQLSEHFTMQSADYWNEVRELVRKEYGEDVFVLPQTAAAGDLSPRTLHYMKAQIRRMTLKYDRPYDLKKCIRNSPDAYNKVMGERMDIAQRILQGINEVYGWAKKEILTDIPVRHQCVNMPLARRMVTEEEVQWCKDNIEQMRGEIPDPQSVTAEEYRIAKSRYEAVKGRNSRAIERYDVQRENPTLETVVHVVQVGPIAFSSTRFELYMDFMHRLQARSPFIQTFVIQLAGDDGMTYLATERGQQNKGYSASLFCNMVSQEGGQQYVEGVLDILKEMKEKDQQ